MKKYFALILAVLLLSIDKVSALNIVSLGDSIPYGFLLNDTNKSYDNLIAEKLDANYYEYSIPGLTSYQLLDYLNTNACDEEIKKADMIFISTGANDYLDLLFDMELDGARLDTSVDKYIDMDEDFDMNRFFESLKNTITSEDFNAKTETATLKVEESIDGIIAYIKNINSDAKIYILNLYNPYFNLSNPIIDVDYISEVFEKHLSNVNTYIESKDDYVVIDAYNILRNYKLINVDILSLNLDPHPNKRGHQALYEAFLKELTYKVEVYDASDESTIYYVLKGDSLKIDTPKKDGYKFVKWDKDLDNINSNLVVRPVFEKDNHNYIFIIGAFVILLSAVFIKKRKRA